VTRGTLAGLQRAEGADIRRAGPIRAAGQERFVRSEWYADPGHASDCQIGVTASFRSQIGPYLRDVTDRVRVRLHAMDPTITYDTINCPCVKNGVRSNTADTAIVPARQALLHGRVVELVTYGGGEGRNVYEGELSREYR
jgi:hypothetical protein